MIVFFFAVNIFFLTEYKSYYEAINFYSEEEIENAVKVLNENNSPVKSSAIPRKKISLNVLKLNINEEYMNKAAKAVMKSQNTSFALPNGTGYSNDDETLIFFEGCTFEYSYKTTTAPNGDFFKDCEKNVSSDNAQRYIDMLRENFFTSAITDSNKISFNGISYREKDGLSYLKAYQTINDIRIDKNEIVAIFNGKTLMYLAGNMFFSTQTSQYKAETLDPINVLFNTKKGDEAITEIETIYFPVITESGSFYLTPSYKFVRENGKYDVWDATSGIQRY